VWCLSVNIHVGNGTASHQLLEMIFTGCSCVIEWTLRSVYSSTNACTSSLHRTSCHCSLQWRKSQPVDICRPLISGTWPQQGWEPWASVLEASRLLVHQRGTVCRRNSRTRHWELSSSFASLRPRCLHILRYNAQTQPSSFSTIRLRVVYCHRPAMNDVAELKWTELKKLWTHFDEIIRRGPIRKKIFDFVSDPGSFVNSGFVVI